MKKQIKKIKVSSLAIVAGVLTFGIMIVIGVVMNVATFVIGQVVTGSFDFVTLAANLLGSILTAALIGAINFVLGAFVAWLYNIITNYSAGLVVELEDHKGKDENLFEKIEKAIE